MHFLQNNGYNNLRIIVPNTTAAFIDSFQLSRSSVTSNPSRKALSNICASQLKFSHLSSNSNKKNNGFPPRFEVRNSAGRTNPCLPEAGERICCFLFSVPRWHFFEKREQTGTRMSHYIDPGLTHAAACPV